MAESPKKDLQRIAEGIHDRIGLPCSVDANQSHWIRDLDAESLQSLEMDLANLDSQRIVLHFPFDKRGRFQLKTTVLLNHYRVTTPLKKDRTLCLVVRGPARRSDDQILVVDLEPLIIENQSHQWRGFDWFWKGGLAPKEALLGAPGFKGRDFGKASRACKFLERQRIREVLHDYQVEVESDLGKTIVSPSPSDLSLGQPENWHRRLSEFFGGSAPWNWAATMAAEGKRLLEWKRKKPGRRTRVPWVKLVNMPGAYGAQRPALYLSSDFEGQSLRLFIYYSGSNRRLHEAGWKRPLAVDFMRHEIDSPLLDGYPRADD